MSELLPCPFCGRQPSLEDPDTLYPSGAFWRDHPEDGFRSYHPRREYQEGDGMCYDMHCVEHAGGCGAVISGDSQEEAIAKWNRRTPLRGE